MPLCEGQKVSKPLSRARGFLVRGFKKTAYPIELVSLINMKITPTLFEAYVKCPTKCWLRATNEPSAGAPTQNG
jgi:hypothetical protein